MQLPNTSLLANEQMTAELREQHHAKIITSLEVLGVATYEHIAEECGMDKHQVGRRLKELVNLGKIYNTLRIGITKTGRKANMYAIKTPTTTLPEKEPHYMEGQTTASDYANVLIQQGENAKKEKDKIISKKLEQIDLFSNSNLQT